MSTFILLTITGFGLGAMYFLIASGLSLIYGLMGVLNFAHGAFITVGSYGTWWFSTNVFDGVHSSLTRWLLSSLVGLVLGGLFAALVELILIRPLYSRHIEQVLVTVGLQLAFVALIAHGIIRHRVMDVRLVIHRGLTFTLALAVSLVPVGGLLALAWPRLSDQLDADELGALIVAVVAVGILIPLTRDAAGRRFTPKSSATGCRPMHIT